MTLFLEQLSRAAGYKEPLHHLYRDAALQWHRDRKVPYAAQFVSTKACQTSSPVDAGSATSGVKPLLSLSESEFSEICTFAKENMSASFADLTEVSTADSLAPLQQDVLLPMLLSCITDYAIFTLDTQGRVVTWNAGGHHLLGYTEAEILGQSGAILYTPEERHLGEPEAELFQAMHKGQAETERWLVRKDGSQFWASGSLTALRDEWGELKGFCKIVTDRTEEKWQEELLRTLYEREHRIAEVLQRSMMRTIQPDAFNGVRIASFYESALDEAEVGGDFFDAFQLSENKIAFAVGDASGKGLAAAARTAEVKGILRAFLRSDDTSVSEALERLNQFLCESQRYGESPGGFLCLTLGVLDTQTSEMTLSMAGAEPPLLVRRDGSMETLVAPNLPLGVLPEEEYAAITHSLESGDTLLLFTDGLTEARSGREFLGYEGVIELAEQSEEGEEPAEMGNQMMAGVRSFAGGTLSDDACLLVVRRL
ncbi:MAG: hypothetical protein OHK0029_03910 [Armatimonadaceae bacterium]